MDHGLASALGARWAIELLVAPAIPAGSLVGLREQVAAAPALRLVPGSARRIDLPPLRAGDPSVSRHRRKAIPTWVSPFL